MQFKEFAVITVNTAGRQIQDAALVAGNAALGSTSNGAFLPFAIQRQ